MSVITPLYIINYSMYRGIGSCEIQYWVIFLAQVIINLNWNVLRGEHLVGFINNKDSREDPRYFMFNWLHHVNMYMYKNISLGGGGVVAEDYVTTYKSFKTLTKILRKIYILKTKEMPIYIYTSLHNALNNFWVVWYM